MSYEEVFGSETEFTPQEGEDQKDFIERIQAMPGDEVVLKGSSRRMRITGVFKDDPTPFQLIGGGQVSLDRITNYYKKE